MRFKALVLFPLLALGSLAFAEGPSEVESVAPAEECIWTINGFGDFVCVSSGGGNTDPKGPSGCKSTCISHTCAFDRREGGRCWYKGGVPTWKPNSTDIDCEVPGTHHD
jgi:hypothetical protein